jgi:hypothetical protein
LREAIKSFVEDLGFQPRARARSALQREFVPRYGELDVHEEC